MPDIKYEKKAVELNKMEEIVVNAMLAKREELLKKARDLFYSFAKSRGWVGAKNFRVEKGVIYFDVPAYDDPEPTEE